MSTFWRPLLTLTALSLLPENPSAAASGRDAALAPSAFRVYLGTYTGGKSRGIYASRLEVATGRVTAPELVAETPSPSFLALHPSGRFLYAVGEIDNFGGKKEGAVGAWALDGLNVCPASLCGGRFKGSYRFLCCAAPFLGQAQTSMRWR